MSLGSQSIPEACIGNDAWSLSIIRGRRFAEIVSTVERHDLLAKFYILTFCLFYALPNVWSARNCFYWFVLPLFLISVSRSFLLRVVRTPLFLACVALFVIVAVTAPFADEVIPRHVGNHVRTSMLIALFLVVTAFLTYRDRNFPYRFFLYVSCTAAANALAILLAYYGTLGTPEFLERLQGVPGLIVYYSPNVVAAIYGVACVGAVLAATRTGISRFEFVLLVFAAAILFVAASLTQSRQILLGFALAFATILVVGLRGLDPSLRRAIQIGAFAGACALFVAFYFGTSMFHRDSYRFLIWKTYWSVIAQRPWVGIGISADPRIVLSDGTLIFHPHNFVFATALKSGLLAGASMMVVFLLALSNAAWLGVTGGVLFPLALLALGFGPLMLDFSTLTSSLGLEWIIFWLPVGLCIGYAMRAAEASTQSPGAAKPNWPLPSR
jgi:O-antigen ligase